MGEITVKIMSNIYYFDCVFDSLSIFLLLKKSKRFMETKHENKNFVYQILRSSKHIYSPNNIILIIDTRFKNPRKLGKTLKALISVFFKC